LWVFVFPVYKITCLFVSVIMHQNHFSV
jgi:hypothetical protein